MLKEFQITAMAECWVKADSYEQAIELSPLLGSWDAEIDPDESDVEDGLYRVIAWVSCSVDAEDEDDAFEKMPEDQDGDWEFDNIDIQD